MRNVLKSNSEAIHFFANDVQSSGRNSTKSVFFENNKPAAFSKPLYAKMSDWLMFKDILLRRLSLW